MGDVFDDRSSGRDISNSIVQVVRFPPDRPERSDPSLPASLTPESTARPRKRPSSQLTQSPVATKSRKWSLQHSLYSNERDRKRQKVYHMNQESESQTEEESPHQHPQCQDVKLRGRRGDTEVHERSSPRDLLHPFLPRENSGEGYHGRKQPSVQRCSPSYQVPDSQYSPKRKGASITSHSRPRY